MDIGEIVIFERREFRIIGFDPHGVTPRSVYLEDVRSGQPLTVLLSDLAAKSGPRLRLVEPPSDDDDSAA